MKIYARNTRVEILEQVEAQNFIKDNHSQKTARGSGKVLSLGLYFEDEIIAVAQFSSPRTVAMKKKYTTELLRMAFKKDTRIVGGASKLIKNFILIFQPTDFFTYQDMRGDATDLYGKSGMTIVKQAKKKEYLIMPGKTLDSADKNEWFSIGHAVRFGPDKLLGTNLGEIFQSDGKRKTNPELFIEELDWHIEVTPGDRIWEWINPNLTFYTYKTTASDSDKYYYGVSHVKKANATIEDCLNDGYFGSGGGANSNNKFSNWKAKHKNKLKKEIISLYPRKSQAYNAEKNLVGLLYKSDADCLNSTTGGKDGGLNYLNNRASFNEVNCEIHGLVVHRGNACVSCQINGMKAMKECSVHDLTMHFGETCCRCSSIKGISQKECTIHGKSAFTGENCKKCLYSKRISKQNCQIHGETIFRDNYCMSCMVTDSIKLLVCPKHGEYKHIGQTCYKCISEDNNSRKICMIHGESIFIKNSCLKCALKERDKLISCSIHGETLHRGNKCLKCLNGDRVSKANCPEHGLQNFLSGKCYKCLNKKSSRIAACSIHGEGNFQGNSCRKCAAQKSMHKRWHKEPNADCVYCI